LPLLQSKELPLSPFFSFLCPRHPRTTPLLCCLKLTAYYMKGFVTRD
jgi:hypothetical protein